MYMKISSLPVDWLGVCTIIKMESKPFQVPGGLVGGNTEVLGQLVACEKLTVALLFLGPIVLVPPPCFYHLDVWEPIL